MAMAEQDGIFGALKLISEIPPAHFTLKIQSFSLLTKNSIEKYESREFEAGGYKWKLVVHPNGNESKNVKGHISVYLSMAETSSLSPGWEVGAVFRLFLLDQNEDNYLIAQDATRKEKRFHGMKLEWGFDEFMNLKAFNDVNNGYLVDDTCVFGVEVFVCKEKCKGKGECLSFIQDPITYKRIWRIEKFSELDLDCHYSTPFTAAAYKWKIQVYPKGKGNGSGTHLSLYLALDATTPLSQGSKICAQITLSLKDQIQSKSHWGKATHWFSESSASYGWSRFLTLSNFNQPNSLYLVKDSCSIEAEVIVHGISTSL